MLPLLVAGAFFLGVMGLGLLAVLLVRGNRERRIRDRLTSDSTAPPDAPREAGGLLSGLADSGRSIEHLVDTDNETPRLLVQAGWRGARQHTYYYLAQLLAPILGALLVAIAWLFAGADASGVNYLMYLVVAIIIGLLAPRFFLRKRASARRDRIAAEVPLFIHLLVLLFEAGLSTRQALATLVREGRGTLPELNREFAVVTRQLDAGADAAEVLHNLERALEVSELSNILSVLRQVDRYGGEVRQPLLEALQVLEDQRAMAMREKVNALSGRMTVVMVLFFFPALLIFVAGPAFASIIKALGNVAG
ncbi:MAG: type II secretion system F family protein [Algiphilus sp.]|nr:type II secretion system F family protein [Algiphilus sp.]